MQKTKLTLETVTPMFLHGYDNRILELRPPPFKALFRYWWRTVQDCDEKTLRQAEAELFGSTDGKAPFSIRISGTANLGMGNPKKYSPLPHKGRSKMDVYDVGKPFNLCLITKNGPDAHRYQQIAKLGFLLGGVGNRSRRGFGSIRETTWKFVNVSDLRQQILDTLNAVAHINQTLNTVIRVHQFQIRGQIIRSGRRACHPPKYPVIQQIYFGKLTSNLDNLLADIGQATHDAKRRNRDYTLGEGRPRMASPIIVRIQMVGCQYIPVVTQLYSSYPEYTPRDIPRKQREFINDIIT